MQPEFEVLIPVRNLTEVFRKTIASAPQDRTKVAKMKYRKRWGDVDPESLQPSEPKPASSP